MCVKYMLFYTAFTTEHFQIFGEIVQKTLKISKCYLILVNYVCVLTYC